jgi:hypothetical protein
MASPSAGSRLVSNTGTPPFNERQPRSRARALRGDDSLSRVGQQQLGAIGAQPGYGSRAPTVRRRPAEQQGPALPSFNDAPRRPGSLERSRSVESGGGSPTRSDSSTSSGSYSSDFPSPRVTRGGIPHPAPRARPQPRSPREKRHPRSDAATAALDSMAGNQTPGVERRRPDRGGSRDRPQPWVVLPAPSVYVPQPSAPPLQQRPTVFYVERAPSPQVRPVVQPIYVPVGRPARPQRSWSWLSLAGLVVVGIAAYRFISWLTDPYRR